MPEPVTLSELKAWTRVDHDDEDDELEALGIAAREFVEQATGRDYSSEEAGTVPERAKTAIKMLTSTWFEHREAVVVGSIANEVPMSVKRLVHQLRNWCEPEDEEA